MTIERAITILHSLNNSKLLLDNEYEAVNMAITALTVIQDGNYKLNITKEKEK